MCRAPRCLLQRHRKSEKEGGTRGVVEEGEGKKGGRKRKRREKKRSPKQKSPNKENEGSMG